MSIVVAIACGVTSSARAITVDMERKGAVETFQLVPEPDGGFVATNVHGVYLPGFFSGSLPAYLITPNGDTWVSADSPLQPVYAPIEVGAMPSGGWPASFAYGADHAVWFTEYDYHLGYIDVVGRIDTSTGAITEFRLSPGAGATTIIPGPDGALWFDEPGTEAIGRVTTSGVVTEYPLPAGVALTSRNRRGLSFGPSDDLYFTTTTGLGRMTTAGVFKGIINSGLTDYHPDSVAHGADGNLWTAECAANTLARVSPEGVVTRAPAGTFPDYACVSGATRMADGSIWLFEWNTNRLGHVVFESPLATTEDPSDVQPTASDINGTATPRGSHTAVHFEYGTTAAYGSTTPDQDVGDQDASVPVSARLTGLAPSTTYHFRTVATSVVGTVRGIDQTVTTPALPPPPPPPPPVDRDGDGYFASVDCDDLSAAIHPGAYDRPGDHVDQDCSGVDAVYERFQPHADAAWKTVHRRIVFTRLSIDAMPAGSSLSLDCTGSGCKTSKTYNKVIVRPVVKLDVLKQLRSARLGKRAVVQLTLSRRGYTTTIVRWTIAPPPKVTILCQAPGVRKPGAC